MRLLLLGKDGQLGWELQRSLGPLGDLIALGHAEVDLLDLGRLRDLVRTQAPDVLVNAAAYTAVDEAESDPEHAHRINAEAVGVLAEEMARARRLLVHYSTEYVFDGTKQGPYVETDPAHPLNVYGASKWDGEQRIRRTDVDHLIFRTSWVYAARGRNFARSILKLAAERDELRVVADQSGAPTSAELIADVTALALYRKRCIGQDARGSYHLSARGTTSWHAYAVELVSLASARGVQLRVSPEAIRPIRASEYSTAARRPMNSSLDTHKLCSTFALQLPDWRRHLVRFVDEISLRGEP